MLTKNKLVVIVGFPILSKLIRGLTVVLSDVCLIPDDQLHNESVNMSLTATFNEPQNEGNLEVVEQSPTKQGSEPSEICSDIACDYCVYHKSPCRSKWCSSFKGSKLLPC